MIFFFLTQSHPPAEVSFQSTNVPRVSFCKQGLLPSAPTHHMIHNVKYLITSMGQRDGRHIVTHIGIVQSSFLGWTFCKDVAVFIKFDSKHYFFFFFFWTSALHHSLFPPQIFCWNMIKTGDEWCYLQRHVHFIYFKATLKQIHSQWTICCFYFIIY